jgi:hypothetical protein
MTAAHRALAAAYPILNLTPVGEVWAAVRDVLPLYYTDGKHASPLGSRLVAASFFRKLTGQSACGLPIHFEMGKPTFQGLNLETMEQDFGCPTGYDFDAAACEIIDAAVDKIIQP